MDIRIMELANRAVRALESISKSLQKIEPTVYLEPAQDSDEQISVKISKQVSKVGYYRAENLLSGMFPCQTVANLTPNQLSHYSQALSILEAYYAK